MLHAMRLLLLLASLAPPSASSYVCNFAAPFRSRSEARSHFGRNVALASLPSAGRSPSGSSFVALRMSEEGANAAESPPRKPRRRRRKDGKATAPPPLTDAAPAAAAVPEVEDAPLGEDAKPVPPPPSVVRMEVRDVRDILSGKPDEAPAAAVVDDEEEDDEDDEFEYVDEDEEEDPDYEYFYEDEDEEDAAEVKAVAGFQPSSSLDQLLSDAKKMRAESSPNAASRGDEGGDAVGEDEESMKVKIRGILSTIVTADFFVVVALLLWFLAGIFCSYVLKDDTVQLGFNGIFEPVVQPALGILMLGSAAGALFKEDEVED